MKNNYFPTIQQTDIHNFQTLSSFIQNPLTTPKHFTIPLSYHTPLTKYITSPNNLLSLSSSNQITQYNKNHFQKTSNPYPDYITITSIQSIRFHFSNPQYNPHTNTIFYTHQSHTLHFKTTDQISIYKKLTFYDFQTLTLT